MNLRVFIGKLPKSYLIITYYILAALILGLGLYLRFKLYLRELPLWHDEQMLVLSILDKGFSEQFSAPLHNQKAGCIFLTVSKIFAETFGYNVLSYRLLPFLSSIISLFCFFILSQKVFKSKIAILTGLYLYALSINLIYFSCEFKPYSTDVAITVILLLLYQYADFKNLNAKKTILYSLLSVLFILTSFPSIFILSAFWFCKVYSAIKENKMQPNLKNRFINAFKYLIILSGIIISCIYLYYLYNNLRITSEIYQPDWQTGFFQLTRDSFCNIISHLFLRILHINTEYHLITAAYISAGIFLFITDKKKEIFFIIMIIIAAFIASYFKIYPLTDRVTLWIYPILVLLLVKPVDYFTAEPKNKQKIIIGFLLLIYLIFFNTAFRLTAFNNALTYNAQRNILRSSVKHIIQDFLKNYNKNEKLLINHYEITVAIDYYNIEQMSQKHIERYDIRDNTNEEQKRLIQEFTNNNKKNNYWIIIQNSDYTGKNFYLKTETEKILKKQKTIYKKNCEGNHICSYYISNNKKCTLRLK